MQLPQKSKKWGLAPFSSPFFPPFLRFTGRQPGSSQCLLHLGYIFLHFVPLPIPAYLTGVFVASISEMLPLGVNDNFSVPLLSASSMSIFLLF